VSETPDRATSTVLEVKDVEKSFGGTKALAGVSFDLSRGSVHALVGGNGSGKSTMIKILAGVYEADGGELVLGGDRIEASAMTPARARDAQLHFVHQQQSTFSDLTVAENLAMGRGFEAGPLTKRVHWRQVNRHARQVLERFEVQAEPRQLLGELGPAAQAMVAIARALQDQEGEEDGVLVLDEPTASLPSSEVDLLLGALGRYAQAGQTILYVSHRLEEVMQLATRATVFRDGRVAATVDRSELTHESLVELIMGRKVEETLRRETRPEDAGKTALRVQGLAGGPIRDVDFTTSEGEIVGIAGLLGSGRTSLLRMIFGALPREAGTIEIDGRGIEPRAPREAIAAGVAYVPEDRLADAAFSELSVLENLGIVTTRDYFRGGILKHRTERRDAEALVSSYLVKAASLEAPFTSMSGGNQQKVILARWLRSRPRVLLLDEPTQGVDVGARAEIWQLVRQAVGDGATALVVSSDMEELPRVCDRVIVIRGGRIATELSGPDLNEDQLDHLLLTAEVSA
jgi:ribose transport system ATP-binding protein